MVALGVLPGCPLLKGCGVANLFLDAPQVVTTADGLVACWGAQYVLDRRSEFRCAHRGADGGWQREVVLPESEAGGPFRRGGGGGFGFEEPGFWNSTLRVLRRTGGQWADETALEFPANADRYQFWLYGAPEQPRVLAYTADGRRWLGRRLVGGAWQDDTVPLPLAPDSFPAEVLADERGQRSVLLHRLQLPFGVMVEPDGWSQVDTAWLPRPLARASATLGGVHHVFLTAPAGTLRVGRLEAGRYQELAALPEELAVACATATTERLHVVLRRLDWEPSQTVLLDLGRDGALLGRTVVAEEGWVSEPCVAPLGTGDDLVVGFGAVPGLPGPVRVRSRIGGKWSDVEVLDAEVDP